MAQHDYVIANGSGSAVRSDLNDALAAIVSLNSGTSEPTDTFAYMLWADTTAGALKIRNAANNAWITLRELDGTLTIEGGSASTPGLYFSGDTNTGIYSPGADQFAIATNGVERVEYGTSEAVFNDGGTDYDFRVEGDTNANLLFVDASTDRVGVGTNSPATRVDVDGDVTIRSQGDLRFGDSDNSNWVALQAPATVASNVTWTLPTADGSADQVLKTDGSGALGWADNTTYATTAEVGGTHTTGSVTSGSASLTVASATGIVAGMYVAGEGIAPGTTVSTIVSTTVTLSANAGATLSSDPVSFYIADKSLSPGLVAGQLCRAWVNFNGTGTVAIRASYNVSSITDHGTGDYTVNFTTAMPDANYSVVATGTGESSTDNNLKINHNTAPTSSAVSVVQVGTSYSDPTYACVSVFR